MRALKRGWGLYKRHGERIVRPGVRMLHGHTFSTAARATSPAVTCSTHRCIPLFYSGGSPSKLCLWTDPGRSRIPGGRAASHSVWTEWCSEPAFRAGHLSLRGLKRMWVEPWGVDKSRLSSGRVSGPWSAFLWELWT